MFSPLSHSVLSWDEAQEGVVLPPPPPPPCPSMCSGLKKGQRDVTQGWSCRLLATGAKCQVARASHCSSVPASGRGDVLLTPPTKLSRNSVNRKKSATAEYKHKLAE